MKAKKAKEYVDKCFESARGNIDDKEAKKACDIAYKEGVEWQSIQPMSQEKINAELTRFISSVSVGDKLKLGQYILTAISGLAINANAAKTTLSTEFTHNEKRYEAKMLITQKEL